MRPENACGLEIHAMTTPESTSGPVSILAVVVLYRIPAAESQCFRSLMQAAAEASAQDLHLKILLFDNSPQASPPQGAPQNVLYHHAASNEGLAGAYNYALKMAEAEGFDWLLTLDQDTSLPRQLLTEMTRLAREFSSSDRIVGVAPQLLDGEMPVSPMSVAAWRPRVMPRGFTGVPERETTALNSTLLWKISHLRAIGGFDSSFWLDYLDHVLCHRTWLAGRRLYIAGNLEVHHQLSILDWKGRLTPGRLRNILFAESAFVDLYGSAIAGFLLTLRQGVLYVRKKREGEVPELVEIVREELMRRLFRSRRQRIAEWKAAGGRRIPGPS